MKKTEAITEAIIDICWDTLERWHKGESKENIIHWFTEDIVDFINNYCTEEEPAED